MPCLAMPCNALSCYTLSCLALLCLVMPCHALPCHALPCYALSCFVMPCLPYPFEQALSYHTLSYLVLRRQTVRNLTFIKILHIILPSLHFLLSFLLSYSFVILLFSSFFHYYPPLFLFDFAYATLCNRARQEEFDFVVNLRTNLKKREEELIRSVSQT